MIDYKIHKISNKNNENYDKYTLTLANNKYCYYYEKLNNQFVNVIEVVFLNKQYQNELEENKIYLFIDNNLQFYEFKDFIEAFNIEFSNVKYKFHINNDIERKLSSKLIKNLNLNAEIIDSSESSEPIKINNNSNKEYLYYDIKDNTLLKNDENEEKINKEQKKENAEYNGYNERLIDTNAKKIVSFRNNKNSSGGENYE
jgi:hypothetical protein